MNNNWDNSTRNDDRKDDKPPFSRIFVVCSKQLCEDDLRSPFEKYGTIEDLYMPRDRKSGHSKGIAYIKYNKTSSAAAAIQHMHMKFVGDVKKPIKVMVATNKTDSSNSTNEDRYKRLFIKIHKQATETEIKHHFSTFGHVDSVHLQRDWNTDEVKGFAYVHYKTFLDAAKAFEECDKKYKAMFAKPKNELKRNRNSLDFCLESNINSGCSVNPWDNMLLEYNHQSLNETLKRGVLPLKPQGYKMLSVICYPQVPQKCIEKLFNIIPGMTNFHFTLDKHVGCCRAIISYEDESAAALAVERINNFEFPSGEVVIVKQSDNPLRKAANDLKYIVNNFKNNLESGNPEIVQLADAIAQATSLIKVATTHGRVESKPEQEHYCSVALPPPQPLVSDRNVAKRCFVVCKPRPATSTLLIDAFSRFGDLIDITILTNKSFGFAKYASVKSAHEAIKTLNGATVNGIKLKVMEADEKRSESDNTDCFIDDSTDRKRMKIDEN